MTTVITEWGLKTDCEKNLCDPPHEDDGRVMVMLSKPKKAHLVNGHATVMVKREIMYYEWETV